MRHISHEEHNYTPNPLRKLSTGANRSTRIRHIITSIMNSETLYVDCLNKMVQVSFMNFFFVWVFLYFWVAAFHCQNKD